MNIKELEHLNDPSPESKFPELFPNLLTQRDVIVDLLECIKNDCDWLIDCIKNNKPESVDTVLFDIEWLHHFCSDIEEIILNGKGREYYLL